MVNLTQTTRTTRTTKKAIPAKDSTNRNLASLKAALNYALKCQLVASDAGWKGVNKFSGVAARRDGLLTIEQRRTLLAVIPDEMRKLATALLLIGASSRATMAL